jgi:hypothetical protein
MKTLVEERFSDFFEKWVWKLEEHVQQLLMVSKEKLVNEAELQAMVSRVTTHYKKYYTMKYWAGAHEDACACFLLSGMVESLRECLFMGHWLEAGHRWCFKSLTG